MTLRNSYGEIMERITVTDEMRNRILQNMWEADLSREPEKAGTIRWKRYFPIAACLALVLIGALVVPRMGQTAEPIESTAPLDQGGNEIVSCASADALSDALGFPVAEVTSLPFAVSTEEYTAYWGELGQIDYQSSGGETASYRKSVGTEDNSGDYSDYAETTELVQDGKTVTLKGERGAYTLAWWTDGTYTYSLVLSNGVDEDGWKAIVSGTTW